MKATRTQYTQTNMLTRTSKPEGGSVPSYASILASMVLFMV